MQESVIKVGHIQDRRNFTHVKDMVNAYYLSALHCKPGEMYLIGNDDENSIFTFKEALEKLISFSEIKEITYKEYAPFVRPTNAPRLIGDTKKFNKITGWKPTIGFDEILLDTLNYWRKKIS